MPVGVLNRLRRFLVVTVTLLASSAARGDVRYVTLPVQLDHEFLRQALLTQLYTGPGDSAVLWDDGSGCGYLKLRDPRVSTVAGRLRVVTRGEARVGYRIAGFCLFPVEWDGFIEAIEDPFLLPEQRLLQFRVVDSKLYDAAWHERFFSKRLWTLVKEYVHPRLEAVRIDLNAPMRDLESVLPLFVGGGDADRIAQILDSLRLTAATTEDTGIRVALEFAVTPVAPPPAPLAEPTLAPDELQRWDAAWQRWDAFVTFTVKQLGHDATVQDLRQALADVLTDARYDILEALAPTTAEGPDPTPALFVTTWERLAPVVRQLSAGAPGTTVLRYLGFIAAGDALTALQQMGPDVGLDISADGLRRMARIVAPASIDDPVAYSTAVDPELRALFGLGVPLPEPDLSGMDEPQSWWRTLLRPRPVFAADTPSASALSPWVATPDTIEAYLDSVQTVLGEVTQRTLASGTLPDQYRPTFTLMVRATAWMESCWRQFIRDQGRVTYHSFAGRLGRHDADQRARVAGFVRRERAALGRALQRSRRCGDPVAVPARLRHRPQGGRATGRRRQPGPRNLCCVQRRPRPPEPLPQGDDAAGAQAYRRAVLGEVSGCARGAGTRRAAVYCWRLRRTA